MSEIEPYWKNSAFTSVLEQLHSRFIRNDAEGESPIKLKLVTQVVQHILKKMENVDPCLKALKPKAVLSGSVADGLQVGSFDDVDCDFMIVLTIPGLKVDLSEIPAFVRLVQEKPNKFVENNKKLSECFVDGYLSASKIRSWFASIFDRTEMSFNGEIFLPTFYCDVKIEKDKYKGPAFTFNIYSTCNYPFNVSVDFVPCLQFVYTELPQYYRNKDKYFTDAKMVYAITKMPRREMTNEIKQRYWRLTFEDQVFEMFWNKFWLKPTIRLFKKLKTNLGLDELLCSFYIKTIFLWALEEEAERKVERPFWHTSLGECFLYMLDFCINMLTPKNDDECEIPFFWNKKHNLIEKFNSNQCENARNQLNKLREEILEMDDIRAIVQYFLTEDEEDEFFTYSPDFLSAKYCNEVQDCTDDLVDWLLMKLSSLRIF